MKFVAKEIDNSVNVSKGSPLKEFFKLLIGLFVLLISSYLILGALIDFVVPKIPQELEFRLASKILHKYSVKHEPTEPEMKVQKILDNICEKNGIKQKFKVFVTPRLDINALALPGGNILVFKGLLESVKSENELAMVLGHELGHFITRDHLKRMGRGLVLTFFSALLLGEGNDLHKMLESNLIYLGNKYSQSQEMKADVIGLKLLQKTYGHVGGYLGFFENVQKIKMPWFLKFKSKTHPQAEIRIEKLKQTMAINGFEIQEVIPVKFKMKIEN